MVMAVWAVAWVILQQLSQDQYCSSRLNGELARQGEGLSVSLAIYFQSTWWGCWALNNGIKQTNESVTKRSDLTCTNGTEIFHSNTESIHWKSILTHSVKNSSARKQKFFFSHLHLNAFFKYELVHFSSLVLQCARLFIFFVYREEIENNLSHWHCIRKFLLHTNISLLGSNNTNPFFPLRQSLFNYFKIKWKLPFKKLKAAPKACFPHYFIIPK